MQMSVTLIIALIVGFLGVGIVYFYEGEAKLIGLVMVMAVEFLLVRERYLFGKRKR